MTNPDQRIDQILQAFAATEAPSGLAQRVSARLAQQAASAPTRTPMFSLRGLTPALGFSSASGSLYPWAIVAAAILLVAGSFIVTHPKPQPVAIQPSRTQPEPQAPLQSRSIPTFAEAASTRHPSSSLITTQTITATPLDTSDATALAETLAPSHPAPPLPLTPQEALLLRSTRPGQPIEIAELDTLRESALSARAFNREQSRIRQYAEGLLGPLAAAQLLTPSSPQPDDTTSVPNPEPPSSR